MNTNRKHSSCFKNRVNLRVVYSEYKGVVMLQDSKSTLKTISDIEDKVLCIFVLGCKGAGKSSLFSSIDGKTDGKPSTLDSRLRIFGNRIPGNVSTVKKALIEAIQIHLAQENSIKKRLEFATLLNSYGKSINVLNTLSLCINQEQWYERSIQLLSRYSCNDLFTVYLKLTSNRPLTIYAIISNNDNEDIAFISEYIERHDKSSLCLCIGIRPSIEISGKIQYLLSRSERCAVIPLIPDFITDSYNKHSFDDGSHRKQVEEGFRISEALSIRLQHDDGYVETFELIMDFLDELDSPISLIILGEQAIALNEIWSVKQLFCCSFGKIKEVCICHCGEYIIIDALIYFIIVNSNVDTLLKRSQSFLLDFIPKVCESTASSGIVKHAVNALSRSKRMNPSQIGGLYQRYFLAFASLTEKVIKEAVIHKVDIDAIINLLEQYKPYIITCTSDVLSTFIVLYDTTAVCGILEIGLDKIIESMKSGELSYSFLSDEAKDCCSSFLSKCVLAAYSWNDTTLIDLIVCTEVIAYNNNHPIHFRFPYRYLDEGKFYIHEYFVLELQKHGLPLEELMKPNTSIFLSYSHNNRTIADKLDETLIRYGYAVKRDIRSVNRWDNLSEFMDSIKNEDYAIILLSDRYVKSENCMYEVGELLKDTSFNERCFVIAISDTHNDASLFFDYQYHIDLIYYWQKLVSEYEDKLNSISPENSVHLNARYRKLKHIAENLDDLLGLILDKQLVGVLSAYDEHQIQELAESVNRSIQEKELTE